MSERVAFSRDALRLDLEAEVSRICRTIRELMITAVKKGGMVVGLSGGVDSSVTAALAARALGSERVLGLEMPERHSSDDTLRCSGSVAARLGIETLREDISDVLDALGCYRRYEEAVRQVIPQYDGGWKSKIVISPVAGKRGFSTFSIVVVSPDGTVVSRRLTLKPYLEIVAATNFKQRTRKMLEYYHADRLNYCVAGTPNRLEYDQGFFVKLGDGAADIKPIAHLYKSQVYQLAEYLGIPEEVRRRPPTTDTYSLSQGQDEFYFSLPYQEMDLCLFGKNHGVPADVVAAALGVGADLVQKVFRDIEVKRSSTRYLHLPPLTVEEISIPYTR